MNETFKKIYEEYLRKHFRLNDQNKLEERETEQITCPECSGEAWVRRYGATPCELCSGTGKIWQVKMIKQPEPATTVSESVRCLECDGKGYYVNIYEPEKGIRACPTCLGDGQIWRPKQPEQPFSFFTLDQLNRAGYSRITCWQCMGNSYPTGSDCLNCISGWVYYPKEYPSTQVTRIREWTLQLQKLLPTSWKESLIETIQIKVNDTAQVPITETCRSCKGIGFLVQRNGVQMPCQMCLGRGVIRVENPVNWKYPDLSYWENSPYAPPGSAADYLRREKKNIEKQPDLLVPIGQRIPRKFGKL